MMQTHQQTQLSVPVTEQSQPASARRQAVALAQDAGMDERAIGNVALLVTELATNLVKHASCGELLIRRLGTGGQEGIEILSLDKGPGIADIRQNRGGSGLEVAMTGASAGAHDPVCGRYAEAGVGR